MTYGVFTGVQMVEETTHLEFPYDPRFESVDSFEEQYAKFKSARQTNTLAILVINVVYDTALTVLIPADGRMFVHPQVLTHDIWIWAIPHGEFMRQLFA